MIIIGCCTLSYTRAALVKINLGEMSYTGFDANCSGSKQGDLIAATMKL
jgi:hypothetical protein